METMNATSSSESSFQKLPLENESKQSGLIKIPGSAFGESETLNAFQSFVSPSSHPCVGAAAAFKKDEYWLAEYSDMASDEVSQTVARDLFKYLKDQTENPKTFATFFAVFKVDSSAWSEADFESKLWSQLSILDKISSVFFEWDDSVSADPTSSNFSFSFAGRAFYVVGLHPNSSRTARSFKYPTLVFNLHSQFEELRSSGKYNRMRDTIRGRDEKLQGSINPMMKDFGSQSEAKQYSGRQVDENWKCPFHHSAPKNCNS